MSIKDLVLGPWSGRSDYSERKIVPKKSVHIGQLKLLLWIVQFLTRYWDAKKVPNPQVVYVGAAPGWNITVLADMFPNVTWHLYDPSPIKTEPRSSIKIYNQFFADEDARKWSNRNDVFFISDIRTASGESIETKHRKRTKLPTYSNIGEDLKNQSEWYNIIKPVKCTLKFKPPTTSALSKEDTFEYLAGVVYFKLFAPKESFESGLVPEGYLTYQYNVVDYVNAMHNKNIIRNNEHFLNPFDDKLNPNFVGNDLTDDYDSVGMILVLSDYLVKISGEATKDNVIRLYKYISRRLFSGKDVGYIASNRGYSSYSSKIKLKVEKRYSNWTNPKLHIISSSLKGKTFHVIQEGVMEGGTKERGIIPFVTNTFYDEYVYASPSTGFAQVAIAKATSLVSTPEKKIKAVIFVEKSAKDPYPVRKAKEYGAIIKYVPLSKGGISERMKIANRYVSNRTKKDVNVFNIPFGADYQPIYAYMLNNLRDAFNRSGVIDQIERIWLVSGSGVLLKILHAILPKAHFIVVQVGKEVKVENIIPKGQWTKFIYKNKKFYEDIPMTERPPYNSVPSYDAKLWPFFEKNIQEGDFIFNVASIDKTARKMYLGSGAKEILY